MDALELLVRGKAETDAMFAGVVSNGQSAATQLQQSAAGVSGAWTEAQQRQAMAMSSAHDQALKYNDDIDAAKEHAQGFGGAIQQLGEIAQGNLGSVTSMAAGILGIGTAAVGAGALAISLADNFGEWGTKLANQNTVTDISIGKLASWNDTAKVTGMGADGLALSM
jgi:hypothetical protein